MTLSREVIKPRGDHKFRLTVRRENALIDALEMMELATSDQLSLPLSVTFHGEAAVDDGGPSRELASLMGKQIGNTYLMEGMY